MQKFPVLTRAHIQALNHKMNSAGERESVCGEGGGRAREVDNIERADGEGDRRVGYMKREMVRERESERERESSWKES